jgi:hypothetical protein
MRQGSTKRPDGTQSPELNQPVRQVRSPRRPEILSRGESPGRHWLREPKSAVWIILAVVLVVGGWHKLRLAWRARKAVARLEDPRVTPQEVEATAEHGRAAVWELLRIFSSNASEPLKHAAGRALARLWFLDQLVAEEEQAIVRRGYAVTWNARRCYPRALRAEIPITAAFEVPFLDEDGRRVRPSNLEWSHRVLGAGRATLEEFSPWTAGRGHAAFTIVPGDFATNGPHRLVLQTRVRTAGLTDSWEIELPHVPFNLEFDPFLQLDAILTLPDSTRDDLVTRAIRLEAAEIRDGEPATYVALNADWTLRNPPRLTVATPLPCDLAHAISIEFEGMAQSVAAGRLILSGQGTHPRAASDADAAVHRLTLDRIATIPSDAIERPGVRRLRVSLNALPESGWADPAIRSIWPGRTQTNWVDVEIVRR